ncbi:MAG: DUF5777 family beta-barrel protein [Chitinophagaceae bacterium]
MWQNITGTFKATQIINTPTVEAPAPKSLQFMIMHRFGKINEGAYALFGLDNADIRFALDYGLTKKLAIGVGRSSLDKTFDASLKWKMLEQTEDGWPFTASLLISMVHNTLRYSDKPYLNARLRSNYTTQLLLANKISTTFSWQLTPAWVHFNLVPSAKDKNDVFAMGLGGRLKVTKRMSLNAEYNWLPGGQVVSQNVYDSFSAGADLETGGHVFQLIFTNAAGMTAPYYLVKNYGGWRKGDIYFGFNITRIFHFGK